MPEEDGGKQKKRDPGQFAIWGEQDRGIRPLSNFERLIRNLNVDSKINDFWTALANKEKTKLLKMEKNIKKEKNEDKVQAKKEYNDKLTALKNKAAGELAGPLFLQDRHQAPFLLDDNGKHYKAFKKYIQDYLKKKVKKAVEEEAEEQQKKEREEVEKKRNQLIKNLRIQNRLLREKNNQGAAILEGKVIGVALGSMVPIPLPARPKPMAPLFKSSHSSTRPRQKPPPPQKPPKRKRPTSPAKRPTGAAKAPNRKNSEAGGSGLSLMEKAKSQGVLPVSPEKQPSPSEQQESSKQRRKRPEQPK
tara:strand:+ start:614 stop:1525 length:912 start_codon:yes stop_codon:yes gene_type:complete